MRRTAEAHTHRSSDRRAVVAASLAPFRRRPLFRVPPPEGRLGSGDYPFDRLRQALAGLGPVFASFGRYLSTRVDLLPRRATAELAAIATSGTAADPEAIDALIRRQLGAPADEYFFRFDPAARGVGMWTQAHDAWLAPGVPVRVVLRRPDATEMCDRDLPLLTLLQACLPIPADALTSAIDDFADTLRIRLDQASQAAFLSAIAADGAATGGFDAPRCYTDRCTAAVLTLERVDLPTLADIIANRRAGTDRAALARRIADAWLAHALAGRAVPFDFSARDILVGPERLVLQGGALEPQGHPERLRLLRYVNAVAGDDPNAAAPWVLDFGPAAASSRLDEEVRRRFRQAVPFRDGEWSGDEHLAEQMLAQWRVAREAGAAAPPHQLHVYRSVHALASIARTLAPADDVLREALEDGRVREGMSSAAEMLRPDAVEARLETLLQGMIGLPQKLDDVLSLAAEGRLRVRLQVPESDDSWRATRQTVLFVAAIVLIAALASILRNVAPAYGPVVQRAGILALLAAGAWLLGAAARL